MIGMFDFLILATFAYLGLLIVLFFACLPKLRNNLLSYLCRGQREANQREGVSEDMQKTIDDAKVKASERKEMECSICLEALLKKGVVLPCSHQYCAVCINNYILSKGGYKVACPTCRAQINYLSILDEGPEGPAESQKIFIRSYNRAAVEAQGILTMVENLPFALHRFILDVLNSSGLILLEKPAFYLVILVFVHQVFGCYEVIQDSVIYALSIVDDLGIWAFILFTGASHAI